MTKTNTPATAQSAPAIKPQAAPPNKAITLENMSVDITPLLAQDFDILNQSNPVKLDLGKEIEFVKQIIGKSDKLMQCLRENPLCVVNAIKNCVTAGLSFNPTLAEAYLIPRARNLGGGNWLQECHFEPGYRGFLKVIFMNEAASNVKAEVVYKEDLATFDIQLGLNAPPVFHKPYLLGKRTAIIGAYSEAIMHDGSRTVEWMSIDDLNDIMGRNETVKKNVGKRVEDQLKSTWDTDKGEMCRKAVIKRHTKYILPHMKDPSRLTFLIDQDNKLNGIDFDKERQEAKQLAQGATHQIEAGAAKTAIVPPTEEDMEKLRELSKHIFLASYKFGGMDAPSVVASIEARVAAGEQAQEGVINTINKFQERIDYEENQALIREKLESEGNGQPAE